VLPAIGRSAGGVREFTEADVRLLGFLTTLKQTGMSLDDITEFLRDGCIVERVEQGDVPLDVIAKRVEILTRHRAVLQEQRRKLEELMEAADAKLALYDRLLREGVPTIAALRQGAR
jgi:DNA-binding transcriptional MerR regulator